jgi:hypothetical protein
LNNNVPELPESLFLKNSPIIIAGSGRSGTTWVLDAITRANNLRTIFEPLNPVGDPSAKHLANRYVRDDADFPELKRFMDKVFSGNLKNLWVNYRIQPDRLRLNMHKPEPLRQKLGSLKYNYKRLATNYLKYHKDKSKSLSVKLIRANLMLGWLSANYGAKTLLVVRHPGAVIASKIRLGGANWRYEPVLKQYCQDQQLVRDYLHKFKDSLARSLSPVEGHAAVWCIENTLQTCNAERSGQTVIFYEDLLINSNTEWRRIIKSLDLKHLPDEEILTQPSQQVSKEMKNKMFDYRQVDKWMNDFSKKQLIELDGILKIFNVSFYKAFEPMPIRKT